MIWFAAMALSLFVAFRGLELGTKPETKRRSYTSCILFGLIWAVGVFGAIFFWAFGMAEVTG